MRLARLAALSLLFALAGMSGRVRSSPLPFDPLASTASFRIHLRWLPDADGRFTKVNGELLEEGGKQRVTVRVDGRSLVMDGPAWIARATRSDQFLAVDRHPDIHFASEPFDPQLLRNGGKLRGQLSLRGMERPAAFSLLPTTCARPGVDCDIHVLGSVSRRQFGMTGDRLVVKDGVDLDFRVRLVAPGKR